MTRETQKRTNLQRFYNTCFHKLGRPEENGPSPILFVIYDFVPFFFQIIHVYKFRLKHQLTHCLFGDICVIFYTANCIVDNEKDK